MKACAFDAFDVSAEEPAELSKGRIAVGVHSSTGQSAAAMHRETAQVDPLAWRFRFVERQVRSTPLKNPTREMVLAHRQS